LLLLAKGWAKPGSEVEEDLEDVVLGGVASAKPGMDFVGLGTGMGSGGGEGGGVAPRLPPSLPALTTSQESLGEFLICEVEEVAGLEDLAIIL